MTAANHHDPASEHSAFYSAGCEFVESRMNLFSLFDGSTRNSFGAVHRDCLEIVRLREFIDASVGLGVRNGAKRTSVSMICFSRNGFQNSKENSILSCPRLISDPFI